MTREEWDALSRGSAIRRAGYAGFKRNVAVAMGNWLAVEGLIGAAFSEAVAVLREALEDEEPLVREHAAWALGPVLCRHSLSLVNRDRISGLQLRGRLLQDGCSNRPAWLDPRAGR